MELRDITTWLNDIQSRPAEPRRVAHALTRSPTSIASMVVIGQFYRAIEARFVTPRRRQLTPVQMEAIRAACDFAVAGGLNALCFSTLNRVTLALQLVARVLDSSLVCQGQYQLCGPAAVVVTLASDAPLRYVIACTELADRGTTRIHNWQITPAVDICNAIPNGPAADWIMCASFRADDRALTDAMYGTCGPEDVFRFLCSSGYRKVILVTDFPSSIVRCEPPRLIPPNIHTGDRVQLVRDMVTLINGGWRAVMFVFGNMNQALAGAAQGESMRLQMPDSYGQAVRNQAQQQAELALRVPNPSLFSLVWGVLTGTAAAHTMHVTFVSHARIDENYIKLSCVNFGQHQRWVTFPLVDFANKFVGYAAASDIA